MTEAEWLACTDPQKMLGFLRGRPNDRKLRLFACECCRRIPGLPAEGPLPRMIEAAERLADSGVVHTVNKRCAEAWWTGPFNAVHKQYLALLGRPGSSEEKARLMTAAVLNLSWDDRNWDPSVTQIVQYARRLGAPAEVEATLLRDVFGLLPFRAPSLPPWVRTWDDGAVARLARAVYEERAFDRLPVLADALEEAGCTAADVLDHLRGPGPHSRGCWVLDLIAEKP